MIFKENKNRFIDIEKKCIASIQMEVEDGKLEMWY